MHEIHIVRDLIDTVQTQAATRGARRVTRVKLKFNPLVSYDADHVQFTFDIAKRESPLVADAVLVLEVGKGLVRCQKCKHEFVVDELPNICPHCDSLQLEPLESVGVTLESYEIEQ